MRQWLGAAGAGKERAPAALIRRRWAAAHLPPALQQWGLRVLYLTDPTGVLWHIADRRTQ
jgi:uncharacterized glyoxalase superfamily protein PhnB